MCGGTLPKVYISEGGGGLSPRVRGNHRGFQQRDCQGRSIPACAGEPQTHSSPSRSRKVYPRVCGGTTVQGMDTTDDLGLSPRVRGNPIDPGLGQGRRGSIPACAGEPKCRTPAFPGGRVYPRVCGGTAWVQPPRHCPGGLSPRVRGNPTAEHNCRGNARSIPACAGEPATECTCRYTTPVYPRVCGGTQMLCGEPVARTGLSPRVRGNPGCHRHCAGARRSIPACAGEP